MTSPTNPKGKNPAKKEHLVTLVPDERMYIEPEEFMPIMLGLRAKASEYFQVGNKFFDTIPLLPENERSEQNRKAQAWITKGNSMDDLYNTLMQRYANRGLED